MAQIKNYAFLSALSAVTACYFVDENDKMQAIKYEKTTQKGLTNKELFAGKKGKNAGKKAEKAPEIHLKIFG